MRISDWSSDVCSSDLEHDEFERRHLAEFALAEQADQQEQDEEHRRGAKNDIHQVSTLMRSGIAPMSRSPSNTAISPRVPANRGGLISEKRREGNAGVTQYGTMISTSQ